MRDFIQGYGKDPKTQPYDLDERHCGTLALDVLKKAGVDLPKGFGSVTITAEMVKPLGGAFDDLIGKQISGPGPIGEDLLKMGGKLNK